MNEYISTLSKRLLSHLSFQDIHLVTNKTHRQQLGSQGQHIQIFGRLVKFGHSVLYLFGCLIKNLAVRFSIYSAVWIRPYGQVCFDNGLNVFKQARMRWMTPQIRLEKFYSQSIKHKIFIKNKRYGFRTYLLVDIHISSLLANDLFHLTKSRLTYP